MPRHLCDGFSATRPDLTEVRKGTERIVEAGTLASEIINRLRSLYKKTPPKRRLVAINEVIAEIAGMLRSEARRHGVSIYTDIKDDLPMTVADRVQLQQVLMNLDDEWHRGDNGRGRHGYGEVAIGRGRPDRDLCK